jgi:ADP-heptose:LPS heptosyltransferase
VILVLRALGLGDLLTAVPALRALRAHFNRPLTLAAPVALAPLVGLIGVVDVHLVVDRLDMRVWRPPAPEVAVNLHGRGPQSHWCLAAARPGALLGFDLPAGPRWRADEHEVTRWCRLLQWYGVPSDPGDLDLKAPPAAGAPAGATVVHPGAKAALRRWPPARFAEVAAALARDGHLVYVTSNPAERGLAHEVARAAGLAPSRVLDTSLGTLAALVARARLVVSGDTGIAHLATAYRTPSVVLFGPMPPALWGPPPDRPQHVALWHGTTASPGDAPGPDPHPALLRITVAEVLAAARMAQSYVGKP